MQNYATCLADARRAAGLTQRELAERARLSLRSVAAYEAGDATPLLTAAAAIARVLGADDAALGAAADDAERGVEPMPGQTTIDGLAETTDRRAGERRATDRRAAR